jgi:hypothetical protein
MIPLRMPLPPALLARFFETRHRGRSARPTSFAQLARQLSDDAPLASFSSESDGAREGYLDRIGPLTNTHLVIAQNLGQGWATVLFRVVSRVGFVEKRALRIGLGASALI